jgi:hypothetical protein
LYLENITDKNLDEISSLKLRTIKIEGGSLGPESYLIT